MNMQMRCLDDPTPHPKLVKVSLGWPQALSLGSCWGVGWGCSSPGFVLSLSELHLRIVSSLKKKHYPLSRDEMAKAFVQSSLMEMCIMHPQGAGSGARVDGQASP